MNKNEIINNNGNKNENSFVLKNNFESDDNINNANNLKEKDMNYYYNDYKNKSNFENKNKYIYNISIINEPNKQNFSDLSYPYPSTSHIFEKRISKENKDNYNEIPKLNNLQKIFIIVYYIFFGHIIISINIFNSDSKNKEFILLCLLLYEFAYFLIQIMINVFMLFVYIIKLGFNSFLFKFYNMIKYKKKEEYLLVQITEDTYYILAFIFLRNPFCRINTKIKCRSKSTNKENKNKINILSILRIIPAILFSPFNIIINPILLAYIICNKKNDSSNIIDEIKNYLIKND